MVVMNALDKTVVVQVCGSFFEFKPNQVKPIYKENIGQLMVTNKADEGLVGLPEFVLENPNSEESIKAKEEAKQLGVSNRMKFLEKLVHNETVSLKFDLDRANVKMDPLTMLSDGMKKNIEELAKLKQQAKISQEQEANRMRTLLGINTSESPDTVQATEVVATVRKRGSKKTVVTQE